MSIATQVFILFILVLAGVFCRKLGYFTDACIKGMTQLVLNVALPAALFGTGKGSGAAMFFALLGALGVAVCLCFRRDKAMEKLDETE